MYHIERFTSRFYFIKARRAGHCSEAEMISNLVDQGEGLSKKISRSSLMSSKSSKLLCNFSESWQSGRPPGSREEVAGGEIPPREAILKALGGNAAEPPYKI